MRFKKHSPFKTINIVLLAVLSLLTFSCSNDDDINLPVPTADDVVVQNFIWRAMNYWYFWQGDVQNLADDRFISNESYTEFLQAFPNPEDLIEELLFTEDRFTFYSDDYVELLNSLSGITKSNGLQFFIVDLTEDSTDNLFGFVRNVVPGSDADVKGLERGNVFWGVNGITLTPDNYIDLLFGDADTYTLNMGDLDVANSLVVPNVEEVSLTKFENLQEHPIRVAKTLDVNGQKIGYLMYQRFNSGFNEALNDAFAQFVVDGVTDLVVDLRYNPGGSVNTTRLLASMIYGTKTDELFLRQRWNEKRQSNFSTSQLEDYFANSTGVTPINTLNLNKVYILATGRSASASELLINGLDPYVEVIHIGDVTTGKNEFSISLVDIPENNYQYSPSTENQINPENSWIIQPLVGRNENADGFFDYTSGFVPDIELKEDFFHLGVLGDPNEPLLARALEEITGVSSKSSKSYQTLKAGDFKVYETPVREIMFLDKPLNLQ
ncbi:MAG: S41 family peptidase [Flavobacteriaceae bacterium]